MDHLWQTHVMLTSSTKGQICIRLTKLPRKPGSSLCFSKLFFVDHYFSKPFVKTIISVCFLSFHFHFTWPPSPSVLFSIPSPRFLNLSLTHHQTSHSSARSTAALQEHTEWKVGEPPPDASRREWIVSNPSLGLTHWSWSHTADTIHGSLI